MVQRKVGAGAFAPYTTLAANVTTFTDAAVSVGNTYQYQVAAVNGTTQSAYAQSNSVTVVGPVAAPSNPDRGADQCHHGHGELPG